MSTNFNFANMTVADPQEYANAAQGDYQPFIHMSPQQEQKKISITGGPSTPLPQNQSIMDQRVKKYEYGLGPDSPGEGIIANELRLAGGEERQRIRAADLENARRRQAKLETLMNFANSIDGPVSEEDADLIMGMTAEDMADPETYFEKAYSRRMITEAATLGMDEPVEIAGTIVDTSLYGEAMSQDPEDALNTLDAIEHIKVNQELDLRRVEDAQARISKLTWGQTAGAIAELFVPGLSWYRLTNLIEQRKEEGGSFWLGDNVEETIRSLNMMPISARKREADRIFNELYEQNPLDALMFAQALQSWSKTDTHLNNLITITDPLIVTSPIPFVGVSPITAAVKGTSRMAGGLRNMLKVTGGRTTNPTLAVEATGDIGRSGDAAAIQKLHDDARRTANPRSMGELMYEVPAVSNPLIALGDEFSLGSWSRDRAYKLGSTLQSIVNRSLSAVYEDAINVARIDLQGPGGADALEATRDLMNVVYGRGSDVVIDIDFVEGVNNSLFASMRLGDFDGELFDTVEGAMNMAKDWYGLTKYNVKTQGGRFYIEATQPVDELAPKIRKALSIENEKVTPRTIPALFLNYITGANQLVPEHMRQSTLLGTLGGQALADVAADAWRAINRTQGVFSKRERNELRAFMNKNRDYEDPLTKDRGRFQESIGEFEREWMFQFDKLPSEKQTEAYFTARTLNDLEYVMRNLSLYRDKTRKGMQLWDFIPGSSLRPSIEGILKKPDDIWAFKEDAGVLVLDDSGTAYGRKNYMRKNPAEDAAEVADDDIAPIYYNELQEKLKGGNYRVVKVTDVGHARLRELLDDDRIGRVDFVVTPYARNAPLDFKQIPYKPGGHVALQDGFMLRQANIKRGTYAGTQVTDYFGDRNILHFTIEKDGREVAKRFEHLRQLWNERNAAEIKRLLDQRYLPMSPKAFAKMFRKKNGKYVEYDPSEPFYLTRMNQSIEDAYKISGRAEYPNFSSYRHSAYNDYEGGIGLEWTGERGGHTLTMLNRGSVESPHYKYSRAEYIDADVILERALNQAFRDRYMGDIKHSLSEKYLAEFGSILDGDAEVIAANPLKAMLEGKYIANADPVEVKAARNYRRRAMEFLGHRSEFDKIKHAVQAKVQQKVLESRGIKGAQKLNDAIEFADEWTYGLIKSPVRFFRAIAFNANLGLLAADQAVVQGLTSVHAVALLGPRQGWSAMRAATVGAWVGHNMDHLAYGAKKIGWKPAHFQEATEAARRTNWFKVGPETTYLADAATPTSNRTRMGVAGHALAIPFRAGESFNRRVGWYGAYGEWRAANPTAKLTDAVIQQLLDRADYLTVNMTQNSNAAWQKGAISLPTQFFSYQARMFEQFVGADIKDKAKIFATYATLYGIPVASGIAVPVLPMGSVWRDISDKFNIQGDIEENIAMKTLQDGVVSIFLQMANDGEQTNFAERVGPGGLPFIEDVLNGDTAVTELLAGVGVNAAFRIAEPFANILSGIVSGERSPFNTIPEDLIDIARTTKSGNSVYNMYTAWAYGKMWSRFSGNLQDSDMTGFEAVLKGLLGTDPMRIPKSYSRQRMGREIEDYKWGPQGRMREAVKALRTGLSLDPATDGVKQMEYLKRGQNIMDTTWEINARDRSRAFREASRGHESMVRKTNRFYSERGPDRMDQVIKEVENLERRRRNRE